VIALYYVPSELQLADFFTNAHTRAQHSFFSLQTQRCASTMSLRGGGVLDIYLYIIFSPPVRGFPAYLQETVPNLSILI
jgi:hypothetical protein